MRRGLFLLLILMTMFAVPAFAWRITNYDTRMDIQPDSSVVVTETIRADFTGDPHHGIYRDLPIREKDRFGNNHNMRFSGLRVTDDAGNKLQTKTSMKNGRVHIRIGDPDVYVREPKTYVIRYKLLRAVHFFNDWDELYWNVVGPEWEVPIERATAVVTLPADTPEGRLRTTSYTGIYGSKGTDASSDTPDQRTARFWMNRALSPGEYMTVVVGWPKGITREPSASEKFFQLVADNGYFLVPPIFILGLLILWMRAGRDPNTGKSEVVAYEPPDKLTPSELGTLIDEKVDIRDISASIIDLAVRGYIHITAEVEQRFFTPKTDHKLQLLKPYGSVVNDPDLNAFEKELLRALFSSGETRWVSSLKNHFYVHIPKLKDKLYDSMVKRGYFTNRPDEVRNTYVASGVVVAVLGVMGLVITLSEAVVFISPGWPVALAVCGILLACASYVMPRKTHKGKDALLGVRGFEEYLTRAERDNIQFQEKHDLFEKFLPYALALGIADKWARAFEGLGLKPPEWYDGNGGVFRPTGFVHDLDMASRGWGSAMTSTPRSEGSGRGGSGFGGGGFSGGGGGGGGGGAW